ncbi:BrnA antitoxin family protein [Celeribacter neptunius]|uniref:BrnA antitoxin of type II toxin-antitoxin system n=1 Tax=Celeribacter neptunius TaxID=588602 RepID=A0A1I3VBE3_9RHOB|nr:BrnA antitoxin family protein [Celeribacter neptunius]SFJ92522.1 BrnA antitoxin of type II toxin-antitoxin system [Celeribacter neptunius]
MTPRQPPRQPSRQTQSTGSQSTRRPQRPRLTKTQRLAMDRLERQVYALGKLDMFDWDVAQIVLEAWATLEQDLDVTEKKVKVTLRLDESVAKFFRAQGQGYQARINRVLGTYAQMKIAEIALTERKFKAWRAARKAGASEAEQLAAWREAE